MMNGDECIHVVTEAIKMGYRHIDGAEAYGNDKDENYLEKRKRYAWTYYTLY